MKGVTGVRGRRGKEEGKVKEEACCKGRDARDVVKLSRNQSASVRR